jgi:CHAD domain-containing protein
MEELKDKLLTALDELTSSQNVGALHDFRVSVRRFLSNINLKKKSKQPLKKIFRLSSPLRDIDTLILKLDELTPKFARIKDALIAKNYAGYRLLLEAINELKIKKHIENANAKKESLDDSSTLNDEFGHFSKQLLELVRKDAVTDKEELHSLRKKLKKIRYRFEHGKHTASMEIADSFKRLQDALGYINDRHAWEKILDDHEIHQMKSALTLKKLIKLEENEATATLKSLFNEEFCAVIKSKLSDRQIP